jgi:hypothetical protein
VGLYGLYGCGFVYGFQIMKNEHHDFTIK